MEVEPEVEERWTGIRREGNTRKKGREHQGREGSEGTRTGTSRWERRRKPVYGGKLARWLGRKGAPLGYNKKEGKLGFRQSVSQWVRSFLPSFFMLPIRSSLFSPFSLFFSLFSSLSSPPSVSFPHCPLFPSLCLSQRLIASLVSMHSLTHTYLSSPFLFTVSLTVYCFTYTEINHFLPSTIFAKPLIHPIILPLLVLVFGYNHYWYTRTRKERPILRFNSFLELQPLPLIDCHSILVWKRKERVGVCLCLVLHTLTSHTSHHFGIVLKRRSGAKESFVFQPTIQGSLFGCFYPKISSTHLIHLDLNWKIVTWPRVIGNLTWGNILQESSFFWIGKKRALVEGDSCKPNRKESH